MADWNVQELRRMTPEEVMEKHGPDAVMAVINAEMLGKMHEGQLPLPIREIRRLSLDYPSVLATKVLDPWYEKHFEPIHYQLMDEVMAPWVLGETVRLGGQNYDPKDYTGLLILQSRSTIKSVMMRMLAQWISVYRKLKLQEDARIMFVHQVLEKAIEHSEAIRETAKQHKKWREHFPEFAPPPTKEWDTKKKWRWPCFENFLATEWSLTCYGESSSKEGGHYTDRLVDDWVTEDSVTNDTQLNVSFDRFVKMDNLRDRSRPYNPWLASGTHYHFQDTYKRLENQGGWLVWRVPAHTGSAKRIFEIASMEWRSKEGRKRIKKAMADLEQNPPGELNFPKMLPWTELVRSARTTGPHTYNCQLQLNPLPEGEQRFDIEALEQSWEDRIPGPEEMWIYVRCDPAISIKKQADETAYIVGGVRWNGERWILDGWIGRESRPTEIVAKGFTLARKWQKTGYNVKSIGYESVAYQEALAQIARGGIPERAPAYHGESVPMLVKPCPVVSITRPPDMKKHERILSMDGPVTRRELKFWKKCGIARKVMGQFQNYPFDRFDALDATHDLWIKTMTPPRPLVDERRPIDPQLLAMWKDATQEFSDRPVLRGTNNTVDLTAWG